MARKPGTVVPPHATDTWLLQYIATLSPLVQRRFAEEQVRRGITIKPTNSILRTQQYRMAATVI